MRTLSLIRKHDQKMISKNAGVAEAFSHRLKGLIGRQRFEDGEALLFPRCNSIHMWMMSIPIDVVFLKKHKQEWSISSLHSAIKPWKILPVGDWGADDVLELPAGSIARLNLKAGEVICIAS